MINLNLMNIKDHLLTVESSTTTSLLLTLVEDLIITQGIGMPTIPIKAMLQAMVMVKATMADTVS